MWLVDLMEAWLTPRPTYVAVVTSFGGTFALLASIALVENAPIWRALLVFVLWVPVGLVTLLSGMIAANKMHKEAS